MPQLFEWQHYAMGLGRDLFLYFSETYFCLSYCYCPIIEDEMLVDFDSLFACSVIFWSTVDTKKFLYYILVYSQLLTKSRSVRSELL